jgi:hypothetical protein
MRSARFTKANFKKEDEAKFKDLVFIAQDIEELERRLESARKTLIEMITDLSEVVIDIVDAGIVQSVEDDGLGVVEVDNTDPANPIISFRGVNTDGLYAQGDGTSGDPITLTDKSKAAIDRFNYIQHLKQM